ncbi:RING finger protein [Reticulomyxa filosa]|uniref:RING finger protein n=1 Tax=Reticulomyxa filosa TaxID=46433 RepID=X6LNU4_RETFI|nr:RING finger protein [Reticulomyxa filosa]|eukprot:ETO03608.1 RING finger protein [Reticulomyxa filosa]
MFSTTMISFHKQLALKKKNNNKIFLKINNPFKMLMLRPEIFLNGYIPSMPEDSWSKIRRVLAKSDGNSFTVLWCKNGHPFFVGECGHPMEQVVCVTDGCGEVVGSLTHSQKDIGLQMKDILQGYQLDGSPEEHSKPDEFYRYEGWNLIRQLSRITCTLLRFLIHLPLLLRDFGIAEGCAHLQKLLNKGNKQEVTNFLWKQATGNFNLLCRGTRLNEEQLAIALHFFLDDFGKWFNDTYPKGMENFSAKKKWNEIRMQVKAKPKIHDLGRLGSESEQQQSTEKQASIVIFDVISDELLWSVKYLSWIGQWLKRVYVRFCLKISSTEGCNKTIKDVLDALDDNREKSRQIWSHFKMCWNSFAKKPVQNGCQQLVVPELGDENAITMECSLARETGMGLIWRFQKEKTMKITKKLRK